MSNRWSFHKYFGRISYPDFLKLAGEFVDAFGQSHYAQAEVTIVLYKELPSSVSAPMEGIGDWVDQENRKIELLRIVKPSDIPGIPHVSQELFERAANVQLFVRLPLISLSFGYMECKGLLPQHAVFYVQSSDEDACQKTHNRCVGKQRPSKLWFGQGDGFEKCHPCSVT